MQGREPQLLRLRQPVARLALSLEEQGRSYVPACLCSSSLFIDMVPLAFWEARPLREREVKLDHHELETGLGLMGCLSTIFGTQEPMADVSFTPQPISVLLWTGLLSALCSASSLLPHSAGRLWWIQKGWPSSEALMAFPTGPCRKEVSRKGP